MKHRKFLLSTFCFLLISLKLFGQPQGTTLNVTNFGAIGDAAHLIVSTISNSPIITIQSTNQLSSADVGKVILLFGAGDATSPTNYADLIATIVSVSNGTNVTLDSWTGATSDNITCTYGTQNATQFQNCINAAGTNTTILIPAGNYLLISPQALDPTFVMSGANITYPAVTISKGGIYFLGAGQSNTILTGNGAWQLKGAYAYRGYMFACQGPVTNNYPLIFDSLTMDGGVSPGHTTYSYFPASTINGTGWDITHDAGLDIGSPPLHRQKIFQNCTFSNWRGEMLKSVVSGWDGFIEVTNCTFIHGNATAFNFSFSHTIENCLMSDLVEGVEFYQGYYSNACLFSCNIVTNMSGALMAINGAQANRIQPPYIIASNTFYLQYGQNGIQTCPAQNLTVASNLFTGSGLSITLGIAGYQGSSVNSNIVVVGNVFSNVSQPITIEGAGNNATYNLLVSNNTTYNTNTGNVGFAAGYGWGTNMVFVNNSTYGLSYGLSSGALQGQWYLDNMSNLFPPIWHSDVVGVTNVISYASGMRHSIWVQATNSVFVLDDTHPQQVPPGAALIINSAGKFPVQVYTSVSMSSIPLVLQPSNTLAVSWANGVWQASGAANALQPPVNLRPVSTNGL